MTVFAKLLFTAALMALATGAAAEVIGCKGCDPKEHEGSIREQIKADRAKYDRENEKVTARPWDVKKDDKPLPDKSK